jgi:CzcA family heavy metal efflux pump/RND family efflux transporter MFP subunit
MWIVRVALQRPYTFIVLAILILLLGAFAIVRTTVDILPVIRIPIIAAIWFYDGLSPQEIATRIATNNERTAPLTVSDIEHSESQSLNGRSIIKFFFQPHVNETLAYAQITGISQGQLRQAPPGTTPPFIIAYDASTVPIIQLALSSPTLSDVQLFDTGNQIVRLALATVPGAAAPFPYGGALRQIQVDLDPAALRAHKLSAADVSAALSSQNLILPAGTQKIGDREYFVKLNADTHTVAELNDLPIRSANGATTYVHDVAHVRDGSPPQTNIVRLNGKRAVLMSVLKTGGASTLDVIGGIRDRLPALRASLPPTLSISAVADQSVFVRAAVNGVLREGLIAALLTGVMILLFLGSWRSTVIIAISIPLAALASLVCLAALGETINIMTLGGLALAVGILVDDATVTVEAIHRQLEQGNALQDAILEGARHIAVPAFVSTLAICIVFVPMFLLHGVARYLFVPLAAAVIFAMLASYLLSRTLVPTLAMYWLQAATGAAGTGRRGALQRWQRGFEQGFERLREHYRKLLAVALAGGSRFVGLFLAAMVATALLAFPVGPLPGLGQDFFPAVDGGEIKLHVRAPSGTRVDATAALCDRIESVVRATIPARDLASITDNIGLPNSGINLTYSTSAPVGAGDADIMVSLKTGHRPTEEYVRQLRRMLPARFPGASFAFLPADIVNQILNFGQPAPLDLQISGGNLDANRAYAQRLLQELRHIPGLADVRLQQAFDFPQLDVTVDRTRAQQLGFSQQNVANDLLVSLSGTAQAAPSYWIDTQTGTQYPVITQTPQYRLASLDALGATPITAGSGGDAQLLANLATFRRDVGPAVVSHYNAMPVLDIYGAAAGSDLGFVASRVDAVLAATRAALPRGTQVAMRGQVETMRSSFNGLLLGLVGAIILVYLLIVVNFQSWLDPLIIISALPAALAGIVWMLFLSGTHVSIPALTGAIMCMGVATANSILVVSYARERFDAGDSALQAALHAGHTRLRPVLMTALAMILGMLPVALGLGEGGEQNAPLGRAVIGGLVFATAATLFFVPAVFTLIHGRGRPAAPLPLELTMDDPRSALYRRRALRSGLALAAILAAWGIYDRLAARAALGHEADAASVPVVAVAQPKSSGAAEELVLPATVNAFADSPIYARTSGYLRRWLVDIGTRVHRGQLLAEIDTPEVDQQLQQARADLAVAQANARLAHSTAARWQQLLASGSVARQDVDDKVGDAEAKQAAEASARANLQRLEELESFKRIVAPFDGVITARRTDVGALISAGTGASGSAAGATGAATAGELFHIAAAGHLRVYVNVPQSHAAQMHRGVPADVVLSERPGSHSAATVVSTADAIDPASRTLLVQLELADPASGMLPGAYAEVHFHIAGAAATLRIPSNALLFRGDGLSVVKVTADNRMSVQPVTVGRDFGAEVEVTSGLTAADRVVLSPPESSQSGTPVRVSVPDAAGR